VLALLVVGCSATLPGLLFASLVSLGLLGAQVGSRFLLGRLGVE